MTFKEIFWFKQLTRHSLSWAHEKYIYIIVSDNYGLLKKYQNLKSVKTASEDHNWGGTSLLREASQPRDRTRISCIVGRFFIIWATREDWQDIKDCKYPVWGGLGEFVTKNQKINILLGGAGTVCYKHHDKTYHAMYYNTIWYDIKMQQQFDLRQK